MDGCVRPPRAWNDFLGHAVSAKKQTPKNAAPKAKAKPVANPPVKGRTIGAASAAAILGRPQAKLGKSSMAWTPVSRVKAEWQKYYQNLLDLHERLRNQMSGLAKESQAEMEHYSLHMGDSGTDNFDRDFALSLLSSDQDAVYEIEEALKRIERGSYGVCEDSGEKIPKARLDAIPWTRFTVEAQARLEKEGALRSRNRLGSLGTVESGASVEVDDDDVEIEEKPSKEKE
jgi:RNA polymerase-binding transcription factor DksA